MAVLLTKLLLAPACVVAVSMAGRRWGVAIAGVLGGLPVVAGPILLVLTLIHGDTFGQEAAGGTLLGLAALTTFVVVFGRVAERAGPVACVFAGWFGFLVAVAFLQLLDTPPGVSFVLVGVGFLAGLSLIPGPATPPPLTATPPWWDLPARALMAMALVVGLTAASGGLGPSLSGLLAPFPIITSVLAFFTYAHGGFDQVRVLLRNFLIGFYGFATFCFVLAVSLVSLGSLASFGLALLAALAVQLTVFLVNARRLRPQPAGA